MRATMEPGRFRAVAICAGVAFAVGACGVLPDSSMKYLDPALLDQEMAFEGDPSPFTVALAEGYRELARDAYESDHSTWDASAYLRRSLRVQAGEDVAPIDPDTVRAVRHDGSAADSHDARATYESVVAAVSGHRETRPQECARAQLLYDNWIEEERERTLIYTDPEAVYAQLPDAIGECTAPLIEELPPFEPEPRQFFVLFEFDESELDEAATKILAVASEAALASGDVVMVIGHADRAGTDKYNEELSLARAESVAASMVGSGVEAERITIEGRGESEPLVQTEDGVRNALNQRVVVTVH